MEKRRSVILFIVVLFFALGFISAEAISEDLHLNIQTTNSTGGIETGTYDFVFNISTTSNCDNIVYSNSTSLTTDSRGIVSYYLPSVSLNYSVQYYLCYYRDGTLKDNSKIVRSPYSFNSDMLDGYDSSFFMPLNNSVFGDFSFGGNVGIGTDSPNVRLDIQDTSMPFVRSVKTNTLATAAFTAAGTLATHPRAAFRIGRSDGGAITNVEFWVTPDSSNQYPTSIDAMTSNDTGTLDTKRIEMRVNPGTAAAEIFTYSGGGAPPSNPIHIYPMGVTGLFINSSGHVGIGTTTPTHKLEVNGDMLIGGNINITNNNITTNGAGTIFSNSTCIKIKGATSTLEIC